MMQQKATKRWRKSQKENQKTMQRKIEINAGGGEFSVGDILGWCGLFVSRICFTSHLLRIVWYSRLASFGCAGPGGLGYPVFLVTFAALSSCFPLGGFPYSHCCRWCSWCQSVWRCATSLPFPCSLIPIQFLLKPGYAKNILSVHLRVCALMSCRISFCFLACHLPSHFISFHFFFFLQKVAVHHTLPPSSHQFLPCPDDSRSGFLLLSLTSLDTNTHP